MNFVLNYVILSARTLTIAAKEYPIFSAPSATIVGFNCAVSTKVCVISLGPLNA